MNNLIEPLKEPIGMGTKSSLRERLIAEKNKLEDRLSEINGVLAAMDEVPQMEKIIKEFIRICY